MCSTDLRHLPWGFLVVFCLGGVFCGFLFVCLGDFGGDGGLVLVSFFLRIFLTG